MTDNFLETCAMLHAERKSAEEAVAALYSAQHPMRHIFRSYLDIANEIAFAAVRKAYDLVVMAEDGAKQVLRPTDE